MTEFKHGELLYARIDSDGDTRVKRADRPSSFDNWLTFDQTERLQFHRHFIEVPKSALGVG